MLGERSSPWAESHGIGQPDAAQTSSTISAPAVCIMQSLVALLVRRMVNEVLQDPSPTERVSVQLPQRRQQCSGDVRRDGCGCRGIPAATRWRHMRVSAVACAVFSFHLDTPCSTRGDTTAARGPLFRSHAEGAEMRMRRLNRSARRRWLVALIPCARASTRQMAGGGGLRAMHRCTTHAPAATVRKISRRMARLPPARVRPRSEFRGYHHRHR